jgi:regulator of sirC expression with transglutaminase-like and TPR domain
MPAFYLRPGRLGLFLVAVGWITSTALADDPASDPANTAGVPAEGMKELKLLADPAAIRALVDATRKSVVVISFSGRGEAEQGLGSGFILREDGLIATNLHVISEARPIQVKLLDGRVFEVTHIYATEKSQDLAILQIDAEGLPALPLGDVDALQEGDPLIAIGNPEGLTHSVVTGVAGIRDEVQGMDMIQLAMPIERGNSGGPVITLKGEVVGLVTLKSLAKENVGFAVAASHLPPLLADPNPIAMARWLTIGVLNPRLWQAPEDANRWTQRAGHIHASGSGRGFGGRSQCLTQQPLPELPYEIQCTVKMQETDGAAGLVFFGDGGERHYGFYPSSGKLWLTQFDGPTDYQWNVLRDERSRHYREGDWNTLKVRVEAEKFICFCNDEPIFEMRHDEDFDFRGRAGLAKFRHTTAEFKGFRIGVDLPSSRPAADLVRDVTAQVTDIATRRPPTEELLAALAKHDTQAQQVLEDRAKVLVQQAERLRQLSHGLHARKMVERLVTAMDQPAEEIDLVQAALLIAAMDNPELDVDLYVQDVQAMADEFVASLPGCVSEQDRLDALQRYLFEEQGFHGSRTNYYSASNSYLNEVIDDREGLPITLSVLYMGVARRSGMKVVGVGLPHHFIVRFEPSEGESQLIDPFERGQKLTEEEAIQFVEERSGTRWLSPSFEAQQPREIILRMLQNLINVANNKQDSEACLRYVNAILALNPESPEHRLFKAVLCLNTGRVEEGIAEADWVLERQPEEIVIEQVYRLKATLESLQTAE